MCKLWENRNPKVGFSGLRSICRHVRIPGHTRRRTLWEDRFLSMDTFWLENESRTKSNTSS